MGCRFRRRRSRSRSRSAVGGRRFHRVQRAGTGNVQRFVDYVVPELRRRGPFRTEYEGRRCASTWASAIRTMTCPPTSRGEEDPRLGVEPLGGRVLRNE